MFRLELWMSGESAGEATGTGTGDAMAARELIGGLESVQTSSLGLGR